jgi:hypothetical protein
MSGFDTHRFVPDLTLFVGTAAAAILIAFGATAC